MNSPENRKTRNRSAGSGSPWRTYLMVIVAGISVTAIVAYGFYKGDRMSTVDAQMANAAMKAKLEAMIANIMVEEALSHGIVGDPAEIWQRADDSLRDLQAKIAPENASIPLFLSSDEKTILPVINTANSKLNDLKALTQDRYLKNEVSLLQGELDKQYETLFADFMAVLDRLEDSSRRNMSRNIARFRTTQAAMMVICLSLSPLIGFTFHRYERGRASAYSAIEKANQDLNATVADLKQTEEALQSAHLDLEKKVTAHPRAGRGQ